MKHAFIALIGLTIFAFSVLPVSATPGQGNGKGPGDDGGCSQQQGGSCEPDRGDECSNGQHTGNPHCGGGETPVPTSTPTVEPTVAPTVTPTQVPETPVDDPVPTTDPEPVVTPSPTVVLVPPVVDRTPEPFGPVIYGNYPQPEFDLSQITALPHAGDGSSSEPRPYGRADRFALFFLTAYVVLTRLADWLGVGPRR